MSAALRRGRRLRAEGSAAAMDIRAGDVDLQPADLRLRVKPGADLGIFFHAEAAHIRHDRLVKHLFQLRQLVRDDRVHAGVLQPHCVEHSAGILGDARCGVAEARRTRRPLEGERAEHIDVIQLRKLPPVAKRAAGRDDGVFELDPAERYGCCGHTISSFVNTGPSLQTRLLPCVVSQVQPMHAPKPQPMRASRLS